MKSLAARTRAARGTCAVCYDDQIEREVAGLVAQGVSRDVALTAVVDRILAPQRRLQPRKWNGREKRAMKLGKQTLESTRASDMAAYMSGYTESCGNLPTMYAHAGGITVVARGVREEFSLADLDRAFAAYCQALHVNRYDAPPIVLLRAEEVKGRRIK